MASSVYYKFKSQRSESRVSFDGTGISVYDLKKEIILANSLQKAGDIDIALFDSNDQEYKDDTHIIPRSSSVTAKRVATRPGKSKIPMYLAGTVQPKGADTPSKPVAPLTNWSWTRPGAPSKHPEEASSSGKEPSAASVAPGDEAAAMAAMFQQQTRNWEETQEKMTHATPIYTNSRGTGFNNRGKPYTPHMQQNRQSDRPLPPSYVCYRCGQKGHWIQDCPTNNDREFDNKPRIKRTTGIPRSFLETVDQPKDGQLTAGVMVTPDGGYVVARPDLASWQKQVTRPKGLSAADVREQPPPDPSMACPIDNKLFRDAVKTPCCGKSYCEECIQSHLLERDFVCPNCGKKIASLDKLVTDKPMRTKIADYVDKAIEESRRESEEPIKSGTSADQPTVDTGDDEQDLYTENQPGSEMDMAQMLEQTIPQLQAQINQLSTVLQTTTLPLHVRQQTQIQYQHLQMQLQEAQTFQAMAAVQASFSQAGASQAVQGYIPPDYRAPWTNPFPNQQPANQDSAYQRLPVNNRRKNLKRDRPSDFLEVGAEHDAKVPRYWE